MVKLKKCTGQKGIACFECLTIVPELFALVLMFYSFMRDLMSKELTAETQIQINLVPDNDVVGDSDTGFVSDLNGDYTFTGDPVFTTSPPAPMQMYANCANLLQPGETFEDYGRNVAVGSVTFIWLFLFWWLNCLTVCIFCCFKKRSINCTKWVNLIYGIAWLIASSLVLTTFLLQLSEDKKKNHEICYVKSDIQPLYRKCRGELCQAATARLIALGLAILGAWLHILCFAAAIGQSREKREEENNRQVISTNTPQSNNTTKDSEVMAEINMTTIITTNNFQLSMPLPIPLATIPLDTKRKDFNSKEVKNEIKSKPVSSKLCNEKLLASIENRKKELLQGITPHESLLSIIQESMNEEEDENPPETIKGIVKDVMEDIDEARYLSSTEVNTPTSCVSDAEEESEYAVSEDQNDVDEDDGKEQEEEEQEEDERKKQVADRIIKKKF